MAKSPRSRAPDLDDMLTPLQRERVLALLARSARARSNGVKVAALGQMIDVYEDALADWLTRRIEQAARAPKPPAKPKRKGK